VVARLCALILVRWEPSTPCSSMPEAYWCCRIAVRCQPPSVLAHGTARREVLDRAHLPCRRGVDNARPDSDRAILPTYIAAYLEALEVSRGRRDFVDALAAIFDVGTPSWTTVISESAMALRTIALSHRVAVVSNSQGWMERHLQDAGVCQVGPGAGASVSAVIDSAHVGAEKPDARIFRAALDAVGVAADRAVHVGDSVWFDVQGALAAGVNAFHFDPHGLCTDTEHEHIAGLADLVRG
jgi:putative hydrolase of the HAD superfamily